MCDHRTRSEKANDISPTENKKSHIQLGLSQSVKCQCIAVTEKWKLVQHTGTVGNLAIILNLNTIKLIRFRKYILYGSYQKYFYLMKLLTIKSHAYPMASTYI